MPASHNSPPAIELPLQGEWYVGADGTEPGHELAFDFMRLDRHLKATGRAAWRELITAVPLHEHHGWGQPLLSPFSGRVVAAVDGCPEEARSYLARLVGGAWDAISRRQDKVIADLQASGAGDIRPFAGNHMVIQSLENPDIFAFLAHARRGSVRVVPGDQVEALQPVAEVGDSGQSMVPHLHFHVMASPNPLAMQLLPFVFVAYQCLVGGAWVEQRNTLPKRGQRIRAIAGASLR